MLSSNFRALTPPEIARLQNSGCSADDWNQVIVLDPFEPDRIRQTAFHGAVRIGRLGNPPGSLGNPARAPGILRATLNNVSVGDYCCIANVAGSLANLDIGGNVLIENVGVIACSGETSFGNGHEIAVLNEGGGRELKITARTSAQIACLSVLCRDKADFVAKLAGMADAYARSVTARRAPIGDGTRIINSSEIVNVAIGPAAVIENVLRLREGTIESASDAATVVRDGVTAEHFIFQKGCSVTDGAMIASSLIGEGARVGKQFSSENSVLFANSEGFHSEVCSIFGGPYTVTHHRSTLLIAGLFSFFNAGSGTNQSNHMYKLGPLHQGILERGCKTGSFSYLLWPARIGAFTAVIGKHYANFDSTDLPFSYVAEEDGRSVIVPAMNFFTVGTLRDGEKWPARDRRKNKDKLDLIVFDVLSPYTAQHMIRGRQILTELAAAADKAQTYVTVRGIHIKRLLLKTCARYYTLALDKYFGDLFLRRLDTLRPRSPLDILQPDPDGASGENEWIDLCGLLCRRSRLDSLISDVLAGRIRSLDDLQAALRKICDLYRADEWNWALAQYERLAGTDLCRRDPAVVRQLLDKWKESSVKLLNMVEGDARKEFEGDVRIGFGLLGDPNADFDAVRGTFDANKFVKSLRDGVTQVNRKHEEVTKQIQ